MTFKFPRGQEAELTGAECTLTFPSVMPSGVRSLSAALLIPHLLQHGRASISYAGNWREIVWLLSNLKGTHCVIAGHADTAGKAGSCGLLKAIGAVMESSLLASFQLCESDCCSSTSASAAGMQS